MDNNVNSMKKEIAVNSDRLDAISKQQEADKKDFVRNVERVIDARMAYHKRTRSGVLTPTAGEAEKERLFLMARRTMLLWPIDLAADPGNAVRGFLEKVLEIPTATTKALNIELVEQIQQGRRSRIHGEVRVVFASSRECDICLLYTSPSPRDRQKSRMPSSA